MDQYMDPGMSHYESHDNFSFDAISDTVLRT